MVTEPELLKSIINSNNNNNEFQTGDFSGEAEEFDQLLTLIKSKLKNFINEGTNNSESCPAVTPIDRRELSKVLNLNLTKRGEGQEGVNNLIDNLLKYSVNNWTPNFCDKLYSSTTPIGVMSELILGVLNGTSHVYHVSPCLIQMELAAGRELTNLLGYTGSNRGGLTFPGGSQSNFMAMSLARNLKFPSIKINGYDGEKLSVFTPQHGHYSIDKAAISLGVGLKRVYKVPCDIYGCMIPEQLELMVQQSIQNGEQPFFVNSSAGSTVLGAFDDFGKISQICKRYNLWYHVDGSWGGSLIFSKTHRQLLNNAELSDSFTVNPHKLLGVPVQCSYLLLQDRFLLNQAHTLDADYLFHNNTTTTNSTTSPDCLDTDSWLYSNMDLADGTVGCGRRPDGFKMFLTWRYLGTEGFTKRVDHALSCAQFFQHKIQQHPNFKLLVPATSLNVCFYYLPCYSDQGLFDETVLTTNSDIPDIPEHYSYITKDIIETMKEEGKIMIDYSPLQVYNELTGNYETIPHFFRMIFNHPKTSELSIMNLINEIHRLGQELME